jgi:hypothetical protein
LVNPTSCGSNNQPEDLLSAIIGENAKPEKDFITKSNLQ